MTSQTPAVEVLYASVSDGILSSLPRMFTSFQQMLTELLQNCARAQATRVVVTWDKLEKMLEITDNGCGLADPGILFVAGDSEWSDQVKQKFRPAGLGLFSLLAFARKAIYESRLGGGVGWRVTATPDILTGLPATRETLSSLDSHQGFTIKVFLNGDSVSKSMVQTARALYPFTLIYQDEQGAEELPPYRAWEPQMIIETAHGRVDWSTRIGTYQSYGVRCEFCREYQVKASANLKTALSEAAEKHPNAKLARAIVHESILWFIPDGDQIQVRLPDRSELVDNRNLRLAAKAIVEQLVTAVIERARPVMQTWPRRIRQFETPKSELETPSWLYENTVRHALLETLGWHEVRYVDYKGTHAWWDGECTVIDTDGRAFYAQDALAVASEALAQTLAQCGVAAYCDPNASRVRVLVRRLRHNAGRAPHIALADSLAILVDDQPLAQDDEGKPLTVRWLAPDPDTGRFDLPGFRDVRAGAVWIGTVTDLIARVSALDGGAREMLNAILQWSNDHGDTSEYWDWIESRGADDYDINDAAIAEAVVMQASSAFQPRLARQRVVYFKLHEAAQVASTLRCEAKRLESCLKEIEHPEAARLLRQTRQLLKAATQLSDAAAQVKVAQGRKVGVSQLRIANDDGG